MSNRLELRGVIVPSSFDTSWAKAYIDKGVMTPESHFRALLDGADKKQDLTVYVNSPGGSVFAGNEIINSLNQWASESGKKITVEVGAMAASMAANLLVMTPASVKVHKNSKIMFHGPQTIMIGGPEALEDQAEVMHKMNTDTKTALVSRTSIAPEVINEWLAEGRMGWLNAQEALDSGLATEILDKDAEAFEMAKVDIEAFAEHGIKIAAFMEDELSSEDDTDGANDVAALSVRLEKAVTSARDWQSKHDALAGEIEQLKQAHITEIEEKDVVLEEANNQAEKLSDRVAKLSLQAAKLPEESSTAVDSWEKALAECENDFAKAKAKFPHLHKAFFDERNPDSKKS